MRALSITLLLFAATGAARADTVLTYTGTKFTTIDCNRRCRFTSISFSARVPGAIPANGQVQFCFGGSACANPVKVTFADGQNRLTRQNAADFQFISTLQLDASLTQVTGGFVSGAEQGPGSTLIYMGFGGSGGDSLGGSDRRGSFVSASTPTEGIWTVKTAGGSRMPPPGAGVRP
jgi:hypothetical protein